VAAFILLLCSLHAQAQVRLPSLPSQPSLPSLGRTLPPLDQATQNLRNIDTKLAPSELGELRQRTVWELLRRHPDVVEADSAGEPVRRGEVVALSPSPATVERLKAAGFAVLREVNLGELDERIVVLRPPAGVGTADALARARQLDPKGSYELNHIYTGSGDVGRKAVAVSAAAAASAPADERLSSVGLIDSGVDQRHPALRGTQMQTHGCEAPRPSDHGTAVASLLVGRFERFAGAAPSARLFAADVYCADPAGGSAEAVSLALQWMARQKVAVINVSLVGPANELMRRSVAAMLRRGHLIVAAVGNDGPAAPPLYPASYPDVVGVTGVDARHRVLPEAGRGAQVQFAAPGADMAVADNGHEGFTLARGTSFASPLVAGLLAQHLHTPDAAEAKRLLSALARTAVDLGNPGWDPVYGFGLVGEQLRVDPVAVRTDRRRAGL
jgi:subtilisin family serine protease